MVGLVLSETSTSKVQVAVFEAPSVTVNTIVVVPVSTTVPATGSTKSITPYGNATLSSSSVKFGSSAIYFRGHSTGDSLSIAASNDFNFGTDDFTVDYWVYQNSTAGLNWRHFGTDEDNSFGGFILGEALGGGQDSLNLSSNGGSSWNISNKTMGYQVPFAWSHIAFVRSGNTFSLYRDGVRTSTWTDSNAIFFRSNATPGIGRSQAAPNSTATYKGYIDEFRISNVALFSGATLTVPTAAAVADGTTIFLLHSDTTDDGVTFTDSSSNARTITAVGDVKHSTAKTKFGSSSILFDGTGDEITVPDSTDWYFGGLNAFTIDFWINTTTGARGLMSQNTSDPATNWDMYVATNGQIYFTSVNGPSLLGTTAIHDGAWHHVAIAWSGTNWNLYIDGTSDASATDSSWGADVAATLRIGKAYASGSNNFIGNLDEIRISNVARYTSNFTPSTTAFTTDANTKLLIHGDDALTDSSYAPEVIGKVAQLHGWAVNY